MDSYGKRGLNVLGLPFLKVINAIQLVKGPPSDIRFGFSSIRVKSRIMLVSDRIAYPRQLENHSM
jgi:hypothetical protein